MQRQCWGRDGAETTAGDLSCHRPLPTLTLVTKLLQYINNTTLQPPSSVALSLHINCIALKEKKHFEMSIVHIQCDKGEHNAKLWNEEWQFVDYLHVLMWFACNLLAGPRTAGGRAGCGGGADAGSISEVIRDSWLGSLSILKLELPQTRTQQNFLWWINYYN